MSADLSFILMLVLRMAVAAGFVVSASFIAERAGPVIGALIATLPISAGPSYVFLALDRDAAIIANGAWGLMGFGLAIAVLHVGVLRFGSAIGLTLALLTCVLWNLALWWNGRRKRTAAR